MLRRVLSLAPAFSLVLCLIAAALWARGYWMMDQWMLSWSPTRQVVIASSRGQCGGISTTHLTQPRFPSMAPPVHSVLDPQPLEARPIAEIRSFVGFTSQRINNGMVYQRRLLLPWWFVVALLAALPVAQFVRNRQRRINVAANQYRSGALPDWNAIAEQVLCPMCDYDLRGLPEARCPECGYPFLWADLLDPTRRRHRYLFEHQSRRGLRCLARTLTRDLRPGEFWKTLYPTQPRNLRRLFIYQAACALAALAPAALMLLAWWRSGYPWRSWLMNLPMWLDISGVYERFVVSQALFMAALPALTFATLLIFQHSMRHARVKAGHAMRCAVYSGDIVFWNGPWQLAVLMMLGPFPQSSREEPGIVLLIVAGDAAAFVLIFLRLWSAYRNYMKFPDAFATALMSQFIIVTAFCALAAPSLYMVFLG